MSLAQPTALPDADTIAKASALNVLDPSGNMLSFGSIFEEQRTIVVFIRHFFCGAYVEGLANMVPQDALSKSNTKIVIIGCGGWEPLQSYAESTGFPGPLYADPTRELYHALGMTLETLARTPKGEERKSYLVLGPLQSTVKSIWSGPLTHPTQIGKHGNISQLGGEFIFGPGKQCSFASRMQHTEDHLEIPDLMKVANIELA
ncbi:hypothetical protein L208DRAFT_1291813 [Tricholoma matsutake]|nr:hypothetical protein L208DRAFT_1291813 [Tricholoma matsutake 945]